MSDMRSVIEPKSDQLNADDLIGGPRTIRITEVRVASSGEQRVSVYFDGDQGKPWKPCKSMCRIMVEAWGPDSSAYVGRSLTLYRDPKVKWGGVATGGIRISHLSHIERDFATALTVTRGQRAPYLVKLLETPAAAPRQTQTSAAKEPPQKVLDGVKELELELSRCATEDDVNSFMERNTTRVAYLSKHWPGLHEHVTRAVIATRALLEPSSPFERQPGEDDL